MSRSIHDTRRFLFEALHDDFSDPELQGQLIRTARQNLQRQRAIKDHARKQRRRSAVPMPPLDPERVPILVTDAAPAAPRPVDEEDLRAVMRRLPGQEKQWLARAARLGEQLDAQLGEYGVILQPPYSRPAPRHHTPLLTPFDSGYTGLWSVLGYPVTVVPMGFDEHGLPVAIQVIARRGNDHLTVAVAAALEQVFGGWVRAEPAQKSAVAGRPPAFR